MRGEKTGKSWYHRRSFYELTLFCQRPRRGREEEREEGESEKSFFSEAGCSLSLSYVRVADLFPGENGRSLGPQSQAKDEPVDPDTLQLQRKLEAMSP